MAEIKSMGLYRNVERIQADLRSMGIDDNAALAVDDLTPFDQYHYEGTDAVDDACEFLRAGAGRHILDVGSGLGGPARYIADRTGAQVTALEIQADLNATARSLTERCGLADQVTHVGGDVLTGSAPADTFDGIVSMLCFLHIPDRTTLFNQCAAALVGGGSIFVDDFVALEPLEDHEKTALAEKVFCPYVPELDTYVGHLEQAGFVEIATIDKTHEWIDFVTTRYQSFCDQRAALVDRYDKATVDGLDDFYGTVASIFEAGRLGGLRITARLPQID